MIGFSGAVVKTPISRILSAGREGKERSGSSGIRDGARVESERVVLLGSFGDGGGFVW